MAKEFYSWLRRRQEPVSEIKDTYDVLTHLKMHTPPVQPEDIAREFNIKVHRHLPPLPVPGTWDMVIDMGNDGPGVAVVGPDPAIFINPAAQMGRQQERYGLSHMLGHYFLSRHKIQSVAVAFYNSAAPPWDYRDTIASDFATELLMPRNWILARIGALSHQSLALAFDVPLPVMRARITGIRQS